MFSVRASVLVHGTSYEYRRQKCKYVRLEECHKEFQAANKQLHSNTADRDRPPQHSLLRTDGNEAKDDPQDCVTAHDVGKQSYGKDSVLDEKPEDLNTKIPSVRSEPNSPGTPVSGIIFLKKPPGPMALNPYMTVEQNAHRASAAVTLILPVAEPKKGIAPSRLQIRM